MELRRTLDGGLLPTATLPNDSITCEDGRLCRRSDAFTDCQGGYHYTESLRNDADVEIITDLLDGVDKWVCEYNTENEDCTSGYDHFVLEDHHHWGERIREWLDDRDDDYDDGLVDHICKEIHDYASFDVHFNSNEYASYTGDGVCLNSFAVGEVEEQIDFANHPELMVLHNAGRLDDILDCVNSDAYVCRNKRRVKNEKTGYYECVGRDTYDPYASKWPDLTTSHCPGGVWHFVVDEDSLEDMIEDFNEDEEE